MEILDISSAVVIVATLFVHVGLPSLWIMHVLSYPKRSLYVLSLCQNEIRDLTATLLTEVCSQVCTKPEMRLVPNPDDFHL